MILQIQLLKSMIISLFRD